MTSESLVDPGARPRLRVAMMEGPNGAVPLPLLPARCGRLMAVAMEQVAAQLGAASSLYDVFGLRERATPGRVRHRVAAAVAGVESGSAPVALVRRAGAVLWDDGSRALYDVLRRQWLRHGGSDRHFTTGVLVGASIDDPTERALWQVVGSLLDESVQQPADRALFVLRSADPVSSAELLGRFSRRTRRAHRRGALRRRAESAG